MNPASIPAELRAQPIWLLWKREPNSDGSYTKVPYLANGSKRTGELDTPKDRARLVGFDRAVEVLNSNQGYAGLAVALGPMPDGRVLSGIDLDDCRADGRFTPEAQAVIDEAASYCEVSPSQTGAKILGIGDVGRRVPKPRKKLNECEIYSRKRFFCITGERIAGDSLAPLAEAAKLARQLWDRTSESRETAPVVERGGTAIVPEGGRNDALFEAGRKYRDAFGASGGDVAAFLRFYNEAHCSPPLDDAEVEATARSVSSRAPAGSVDGPSKSRATDDQLAGMPYVAPVIVPGLYPRDAGGRVGTGGCGKSTLSLFEAVHVILGRELYGKQIEQPGAVLVVTAEDRREQMFSVVNRICRALELSPAEVARVREGLFVEDLSRTTARLVTRHRESGYSRTALFDELTRAYQSAGLAMCLLDPVSLIGSGDETNEAHAELLRTARGLSENLQSNVTLIHHVAQQTALAGLVHQYAGRGGTAFADNSRFAHQITRVDWRTLKVEGRTFEIARTVPDALINSGALIGVLIHKLSYEARDGVPIVLHRQGFNFCTVPVAEIAPDSVEQRESRDAELATAICGLLASKATEGLRYSRRDVAAMFRAELGASRDHIRRVLDELIQLGRIEERGETTGKAGRQPSRLFVRESYETG